LHCSPDFVNSFRNCSTWTFLKVENRRKPRISRVLDTQAETDIEFSTFFSLNIHFRCLDIYIGKYIFKHLKCIFKLKKVENTIYIYNICFRSKLVRTDLTFISNSFANNKLLCRRTCWSDASWRTTGFTPAYIFSRIFSFSFKDS